MKTIKLLTALCLTLAFGNINAQGGDTGSDSHTIDITIPAVALVDIEPSANKNITMGFAHTGEAGEPITPIGTNNELWLNYSYIPSGTGKSARVDVNINSVIPGVDIKVTAGAQSGGNSGGAVGEVALTALTLSTAPTPIITSIPGASYTGTGETNGHNLTYSLAIPSLNYTNLVTDTYEKTVTYTIVEN